MFTRRDWLRLTGAAIFCTAIPSTRAADAPKDARLGAAKTLDDYFPFTPPKTKEEWEKRRERIREQVLVSQGLWPMPEKCPLKAVVHSPIDRKEYTVEKVSFESTPGHFVTGSLYRPKAKTPAKRPGILFAHGHWSAGRFQEETEATARAMMARGEEPDLERGRYHIQALPVALAKLGFVVFAYDMVGYADSTAIPHIASSGVPHKDGFADAESELRLQSLMGLQTLNSIRSLDFLCELPDVDADKLGMSGASGGGTQTFILAAIDERIKVAVPAVMVSTAMQGGCVCENCSLLRVGTGNVELAALFAPRPMALPSANDWTKEIMTKGYPQLKPLYKLLGAEENVTAKAWIKLPHNYGRPSREFAADWFNKHLMGKDEASAESPFVPIPPKELSVYDETHPRPKGELNAKALRAKWTEAQEKQLAGLAAFQDAKGLEKYQSVLKKALRGMIADELPSEIAVRKGPDESKGDGYLCHRAILGRKDEADAVPHAGVMGPKFSGKKLVIWLHPEGRESLFDGDKLKPEVAKLTADDFAVVAPDLFGSGGLKLEKGFPVNKTYSAFTYGYNRSLLAQRIHDALTTIAFAKTILKVADIRIVGWGDCGPVALLAKAASGGVVSTVVADLNQFDFANVKTTDDPMMLPGALRYGGLEGLMLADPSGKFFVHNVPKAFGHPDLKRFAASKTPILEFERGESPMKPGEAIERLLK